MNARKIDMQRCFRHISFSNVVVQEGVLVFIVAIKIGLHDKTAIQLEEREKREIIMTLNIPLFSS